MKRGEVGGNLIYKYKSYNIVKCGLSWIDFIEDQLFNAIKNKQPNLKSFKEIKSEISEIAKFCKSKISGLLDIDSDLSPISSMFKYNIVEWIDAGGNRRLKDYEFEFGKKEIFFEYSKDQIIMRNDFFKRYGTSINAVSKIVTRMVSLESQFRQVKNDEIKELRNIYKTVDDKWLTKYAMSG